MKKNVNQLKIVVILTFVLCFGFNFGMTANAQRQRVITKPTPTPTPKKKTAPTPKPTTVTKVTPTPTPTATPNTSAIKSLADLQAKIRLILSDPQLRRGQIGVKIVSLDTDSTVFEQDAEKYFMPASNMKSFTVAAAMERLSPDFRFVTSVFAPAKPDANGTIRGDLTIYGRGDVSISTAFNDGDYFKGLEALADKIAQTGVKRIEGNLVGDESYFTGHPIPLGWEWDDLQWYYGAEISALPVNDNAVDLKIRPNSPNEPCSVQIQPLNTILKVVNRCLTSSSNEKRSIQIVKKLDQNILEITGTMPSNDRGFSGYVAISHPAELFIEMLRGLLIQKGVYVTGQNRIVHAQDKAVLTVASQIPPVEIARLESPPFSVIAAKTMKPSQNLYTETILRALGEQAGDKSDLTKTSAERGINVVQKFLSDAGIPSDSVIQWDGSGLSRHNLVTPASLVQLYSFMSKSRYSAAWRDSLTIGGVDGTLQNRFKGTSAAANVRGKTGTIDQVSALSGYLTTASGERLVFSILVNGINNVRLRQATIDEIVLLLANFKERTS